MATAGFKDGRGLGSSNVAKLEKARKHIFF